MKKFFNKVKSTISAIKTVMTVNVRAAVEGTAAEAYVDTGVKVLIAVVIGALILTLLYALFNNTIMPNVTDKVVELFNYAG